MIVSIASKSMLDNTYANAPEFNVTITNKPNINTTNVNPAIKNPVNKSPPRKTIPIVQPSSRISSEVKYLPIVERSYRKGPVTKVNMYEAISSKYKIVPQQVESVIKIQNNSNINRSDDLNSGTSPNKGIVKHISRVNFSQASRVRFTENPPDIKINLHGNRSRVHYRMLTTQISRLFEQLRLTRRKEGYLIHNSAPESSVK